MTEPHAHIDFDSLPPLRRDRAYWGMTITQFLGALNDTIFKQLVLLLCLRVVTAEGNSEDKQFLAQAIFALPFVLFSGIAGFWSDRVVKRNLIIACKVFEIAVMAAAAGTFAWMAAPTVRQIVVEIGGERIQDDLYLIHGLPWLLFVVLFLMGLQSTIFGPAKYGILPEMVRGEDLPRFNGDIQMTTFIALIVGVAIGGKLLDMFYDALWLGSLICVGIAVVGTSTSWFVRRTPVAQQGAPFSWAAFAADKEVIQLLKRDKPLCLALVAYSLFWFVTATLPMTFNWLGKYQFRLDYFNTSMLLATSSIGIAIGFVLGGWYSKGRVRFGLVRIGTWGLIICLVVISLPGSVTPQRLEVTTSVMATADDFAAPGTSDTEEVIIWPHLLGRIGSQLLLVLMGVFAGLFALPIQVYLQSRPPENLKGRMIGTMNLINWIAIIGSAVFYGVCGELLASLELPKFFIFGITGLLLLPLAMFYRPKDVILNHSSDA
ncbi:MAG: MFS transporter [Pirellulales bacterium]|nr:MFS transporter [Pirellulales bacterium]